MSFSSPSDMSFLWRRWSYDTMTVMQAGAAIHPLLELTVEIRLVEVLIRVQLIPSKRNE